jgi:hypothetical protein
VPRLANGCAFCWWARFVLLTIAALAFVYGVLLLGR